MKTNLTYQYTLQIFHCFHLISIHTLHLDLLIEVICLYPYKYQHCLFPLATMLRFSF